MYCIFIAKFWQPQLSFITVNHTLEDVTVAENPRTHLDFNLSRRSFGYLQVLHQLDVSQEVSGCGGEP